MKCLFWFLFFLIVVFARITCNAPYEPYALLAPPLSQYVKSVNQGPKRRVYGLVRLLGFMKVQVLACYVSNFEQGIERESGAHVEVANAWTPKLLSALCVMTYPELMAYTETIINLTPFTFDPTEPLVYLTTDDLIAHGMAAVWTYVEVLKIQTVCSRIPDNPHWLQRCVLETAWLYNRAYQQFATQSNRAPQSVCLPPTVDLGLHTPLTTMERKRFRLYRKGLANGAKALQQSQDQEAAHVDAITKKAEDDRWTMAQFHTLDPKEIDHLKTVAALHKQYGVSDPAMLETLYYADVAKRSNETVERVMQFRAKQQADAEKYTGGAMSNQQVDAYLAGFHAKLDACIPPADQRPCRIWEPMSLHELEKLGDEELGMRAYEIRDSFPVVSNAMDFRSHEHVKVRMTLRNRGLLQAYMNHGKTNLGRNAFKDTIAPGVKIDPIFHEGLIFCGALHVVGNVDTLEAVAHSMGPPMIVSKTVKNGLPIPPPDVAVVIKRGQAENAAFRAVRAAWRLDPPSWLEEGHTIGILEAYDRSITGSAISFAEEEEPEAVPVTAAVAVESEDVKMAATTGGSSVSLKKSYRICKMEHCTKYPRFKGFCQKHTPLVTCAAVDCVNDAVRGGAFCKGHTTLPT